LKQLESGAELGERLRDRRLSNGAASCLFVILNRLCCLACSAEVVREHHRLNCCGLGKALLQDLRDARVELLPSALE
jgi:hypothetical protein